MAHKSCRDCTHAIFDTVLGEFKCDVKKRFVTVFFDVLDCDNYSLNKGELKISKDTHEEDK